jgi:hypothetical protein
LIVAWLYEYTKNPLNYTIFKGKILVYKLYLNKAGILLKSTSTILLVQEGKLKNMYVPHAYIYMYICVYVYTFCLYRKNDKSENNEVGYTRGVGIREGRE